MLYFTLKRNIFGEHKGEKRILRIINKAQKHSCPTIIDDVKKCNDQSGACVGHKSFFSARVSSGSECGWARLRMESSPSRATPAEPGWVRKDYWVSLSLLGTGDVPMNHCVSSTRCIKEVLSD